MSLQRRISWAAARRDLHADRCARTDIREEAVSTPGLTGWRGLSGRRYVASVQSFEQFDCTDIGAAVLIAVKRNTVGLASIINAAAGLTEHGFAAWAETCREHGANELHVHRLSASPRERGAMVRDLTVAVTAEVL